MSLIYNKILTHFSGLNSVALNANGDLAAVCFHDRELFIYRIIEGSQKIDLSQIVKNPNIGALPERGSLEEYRFIRLPLGRYNRPPDAEVNFRDTKLAFLNDEILLVARQIEQVGGGRSTSPDKLATISLAAVKIATGGVVAEFTDSEYGPLFAAPLLIPPKYILFPAGHTAICLDTPSFREVFRLPKTGEQFSDNGIAYDSGTETLYVLWREFESSFLQTYRLHPDRGAVETLQRRPLELEGFLGNSLCLRPDGKEVAIWFTIMHDVVHCRTKEDRDYWETGRLGRLGIFTQEGDRYFDVRLKFERYEWHTQDLHILSVYSDNPERPQTETAIGVRYTVNDPYESKPFYLDDHTVVINAPGGDFIGIDTVSGKSEILMNEWSPIKDLSVHPPKRLLLIGTKGSANAPIAVNLLGLA